MFGYKQTTPQMHVFSVIHSKEPTDFRRMDPEIKKTNLFPGFSTPAARYCSGLNQYCFNMFISNIPL